MKLKTKDGAVKIAAIIFTLFILYGIGQFSEAKNKGVKFTDNAFGITLQGVGFLLILWASKTKVHLKADSISKYEGEKSRILSAINYPKTYDLGLLFVLLGLFFQFIALGWSD